MSTTGWLGRSEPAFRRRVVVAAPHPDDEILGCGGIMHWLIGAGYEVEIVAVTDGDASHPGSARITRAELVDRRATERIAALRELGLSGVPVHRLGIPDAGVAARRGEVEAAFRRRLDPMTTVVVPWRHDGHPDHEAVGRAGIAASNDAGAGCLEVPIWARVRGQRCDPTHILDLGPLRMRKRAAAACYRSQLEPLGPDPSDGPVVHPGELDLLTSRTEWVVATS